ncbi:MAG: protease modulator HflC [Myxococcales bacterium]|nr:protease modulator HflC [Myxococcales bacterium]MDD9967834.1 protease modulator HflC [Myxococcales bacterium]
MNRVAALVVAVLMLGVGLSESLYVVNEYEQVIVTQFGKIIGEGITDPGLHFKVPVIQHVHHFDKRWLEWDGSPNEIPTKDKKYIWTDTYARWRIKDPVVFYQRLRDEVSAQSRLDDIIDGEVRNVIANHALIDLVRTGSREFTRTEAQEGEREDKTAFKATVGRAKLGRMILEKAQGVMPEYGIELADIQFKRINYVSSVQQKVFERMISERKRIAQLYRSEGLGKASEIEGRIEREQRTIQSEAYRKAEEIRGKADAEAAAIYAHAYNRDPELYEFVKSLETIKRVIDPQTDLVLSTDNELLKYLRRK